MTPKTGKDNAHQPKEGKTPGGGRSLTETYGMPRLPEKAQRVLSLLSDTDVSVEKLRRLIETDAALASKILNIANFDFYGGGKTMPNLTHAVMRLGFNAVRNIVVATSLKAAFKRFEREEELLWTSMMASAMASSIIARQTKIVDPEDAFIVGLLHDVGRVHLINVDPALYRRLLKNSEARHIPFDAAVRLEADNAGTTPFNQRKTQRKTGAMIVKKWGFPETLAEVVKKFDSPEEFVNERYLYNLVTVITLADMICLTRGIGGACARRIPGAQTEMENLSDALGVDEKGFKKLSESINAAFSQGIKLY